MSDDEQFGEERGAFERTLAIDPIQELIMGEDVAVYRKHLSPEQRVRYEFNKYLESGFKPFQDIDAATNRQYRLKFLRSVANLPEIANLNPQTLAASLAFYTWHGRNIKESLKLFDAPPWASDYYTQADILRYLRFLATKNIVKLD